MLGRRQSWPSLLILGVGVITLALTLKGRPGAMPLEPSWLLAAAGGVYVVLGLLLGGATWRWPAVTLIMAATHALMALLMGYGYGAIEGQGRAPYEALAHGLWDYLPGTVLQVGFAGALGAVAVAWWTRTPCTECYVVPPETEPEVICLPDLDPLAPPAESLAQVVAVEGVGAALAAEGAALVGAGAWARDPQAALARVRRLARLTGAGLNTYDLGPTRLVVRCEDDRCAAVLTTVKLPTALAHELLRGVWSLDLALLPPPEDEATGSAGEPPTAGPPAEPAPLETPTVP